MSGYVPDPNDITQPIEAVISETAAAEFRALKAKVNSIAAGTLVGTGIRNILVNGNFEVNQESSLNLITPAVVNGIAYVSDQWNYLNSGGVASLLSFQSLQSATDPTPADYRTIEQIRVAVQRSAPGAGEQYTFEHPVEGFKISHLRYGTSGARTSTLLFWANATIAGNYAVSIRNGAGTRSYVALFNITAINTWIRFAIVIPGDTVVNSANWPSNGTSTDVRVGFDLGSGTALETATPNQWTASGATRTSAASKLLAGAVGNALRITGVEWKDGAWDASGTPEVLPFDLNLLQCRRYFNQLSTLIMGGTGPGLTWITFPTTMRRIPQISGGGATFTVQSLDNNILACNQGTTAVQVLRIDARLGVVA